MKNKNNTQDVAIGSKKTETAPLKTVERDLIDEFLDGEGDEASDEQKALDHSITKDLMGKGPVVGGIKMRPLSLAMVMLLHEVGNEIMIGKRVGEMANPLLAAGEFLFVCNSASSLDDVTDLVFNHRTDFKKKVISFCQTVTPSDSLILDVIAYINDATSTRVNAELPQHMQGGSGSSEPMGNE